MLIILLVTLHAHHSTYHSIYSRHSQLNIFHDFIYYFIYHSLLNNLHDFIHNFQLNNLYDFLLNIFYDFLFH